MYLGLPSQDVWSSILMLEALCYYLTVLRSDL